MGDTPGSSGSNVADLFVYYYDQWTVPGQGSNANFSWTTNGGASWGTMEFWVATDSGQLNIDEYEPAGPKDPSGTTVKKKADGTVFTTSVSALPFPTIVAKPGNSVRGNSSTTINGAIFFNEPSDGINTCARRLRMSLPSKNLACSCSTARQRSL
jgi:hypothetical protein